MKFPVGTTGRMGRFWEGGAGEAYNAKRWGATENNKNEGAAERSGIIGPEKTLHNKSRNLRRRSRPKTGSKDAECKLGCGQKNSHW